MRGRHWTGILLLLCGPLAADPPGVTRVPIPADTTTISIDGTVLPLKPLTDIARFGRPALYVPAGRHLIRVGQQTAYRIYRSKEPYSAWYRTRRDKLTSQGKRGRRTLLTELARRFDNPPTAEPLHLLGNYHYHNGAQPAAIRLYRRALALNPAYAPSHLNLAFCLLEARDKAGGLRELRLARAFNPSDVFGIDALIERLAAKHRLALTADRAALQFSDYAPPGSSKLSQLDRRFVRFYTGMGKYLTRPEERAKSLSNLGLYFQRQKKPAAARRYYAEALGWLGRAGQSEDTFRIAAVILKNLSRTLGSNVDGEDYRLMAEISESLK